MRYLLICLLLIVKSINSLHIDEYISYLEELSLNEQFVEDYAKWSFKLFSQPDYVFGEKPKEFSCKVTKDDIKTEATSVHALRPQDINCVGALGDSLTAGLGAHALTPIGLFTENRGSSWSVGGDHTYNTVVSLPNILRQYNPSLKGYSTKSSVIFLKGQNSSHNGLNVAKSGDKSYHMLDQAHILYERLRSNEYCDWENDWKVITFFVGGNDLCIFCEDVNKHSPSNYVGYVRETLDFLHTYFPRTFVNLVLVLDVRSVKELNAGGTVCQALHKKTCPCAAFPTDAEAKQLDELVPAYHQGLLDLVNHGKYDTRDDFTVVIQPFMANTTLPKHLNNEIDYSYFAPDCFHFSGKGHSRAALSLWNNMLEPVNEKKWQWYPAETLECPTEERPYFFTLKNSPQSIEKGPQSKPRNF